MAVEYGHNDLWPVNTWIALYIETYNRGPVLPTEIGPYLEKLGLDVYNPESGFLSFVGQSLVEYNEEQEIGRSVVFVRDHTGKMSKARLIAGLATAPWTPREEGPHMPSVSYWPKLSDEVRDSQDMLDNLWAAQEGGQEAWDFAKFMGTVLKVGLFASAGILVYGLYRKVVGDPLETATITRGKKAAKGKR